MLAIYPEDRAKAIDMIRDPWLINKSRNKDHICTSEEEIIKQQEKYSAKRDTVPYFRDIKNFSETFYDADVGESMDEESEDEDGCWCKKPLNFIFREGSSPGSKVPGEKLRSPLYRL